MISPGKGVNRKNIWNHHSDLISPHRAAAAMTHGSTINPLCRSKVFGFRITSWNSKPPKSTAMLKKCRNRGIHQVDSNWVSEVESINENNPYSANKPWNKSLNFRFPTKHVIPKSLKVGHWLSKNQNINHIHNIWCVFFIFGMNYYLVFYQPPLYSRLHLTPPPLNQKKNAEELFPPKCLQTHFRGETETAPIACHRGRPPEPQATEATENLGWGNDVKAPPHWREPRKTRVGKPRGDIWVLNQKSGENPQNLMIYNGNPY